MLKKRKSEFKTKSDKDLNRSFIVRIGKKLRGRINPYIKKHSKVGDAAIISNDHFPWIQPLEKNWEIIRDEAMSVLRFKEAIPPLSDISPDHAKLDAQKNGDLIFFGVMDLNQMKIAFVAQRQRPYSIKFLN